MATTNVDIANIALRMLGEPAIVSLDGTQRAQVLCAQEIGFARDEVIGYHPWSIAVKRKVLNELTEETNLTGYDHVYAMPSDALRILAIRPTSVAATAVVSESGYLEDSIEDGSSYLIEGGNIYTNADDAYAQYIMRVTNPSQFPQYLVDTIAANLARRIAYSLVQNPTVMQLATQSYSNAMSMALQIDSKSKTNTPSAPVQWSEVF